MRSQIAFVVCLLALAGCGGGGGGGSSAPPPAAPAPPPPAAPAPPPVIGASGGTVTESTGAKVTFPAGAIAEDTTFRIAVDSTGAPPVPAGLTSAGSMYVITPHGGDFQQPVVVSIPVPNVALLPTQQLKIAKAQPNGEWEILADSTIVNGKLEASVGSFSFFMTVVVTFPLPILQVEPISFTSTLDCGDQNCTNVLGPVTATYSVTHNNGQLPESCANPTMETRISSWDTQEEISRPLGSYVYTRTFQPAQSAAFQTILRCPSYTSVNTRKSAYWTNGVYSPNLAIERMPAQIDVVEGLQAYLEVLMSGGSIHSGPGSAAGGIPTRTNRAVIDWERSDDAGASWRQIARSFQDEANSHPFGTGLAWRPWGVRHGFIATATDQGALMRVHACYSAPASTAPPNCVTSSATRINVLQASALPAIVDAPRSVLIRTAETASFSAAVSGAPAPTLQWQTRPANSTGEWTDVIAGSGATTANYTTSPRMPSHNGEQYRVLATNTLGSAASAPVILSVSDLDVAPSITTQPASLSVVNGNDAVFAVVAHGTEALSYQWRFNGSNIAGANNPVLRLEGVSGANAGSYTVAVSNGAGNATSNAAVLNVTAGTPSVVAPSIVTQPSDVSVNAGSTATLAVGVAGTGPFTFQWLRDGVPVSGATSAVLTFNSVALPNAGGYSVRVTNSAGQVVSDTVQLDVIAPAAAVAPTITSQPATLVLPLNGSGTIAVGATGTGPLSYQWSLNGSPLPGSTEPVLHFAHLGQVDFGTYTVTVSNSIGSVTSQAAQLILLGAPVITQEPAAVTATEGNTATFHVSASGSGLRYQWLRNGTQIPGAIAATYNTPSLVAANTGAVYSVMVYNGAGLVTSQGAVLTVQVVVAPSVTQHPVNASIQPGQTAQICATFGGTTPMNIHFERWNGSSWAQYTDITALNNNEQCFPTPQLTLGDNGAQFRVVAGNSAGAVATSAMTVTVAAPSGISTTTLVSVELDGGEPDYYSGMPSVSADGRLVAFTSSGTNLVAGITNTQNHAYLRDLSAGTTTLINRTTTGGESYRGVQNLALSSSGRYAVFTSFANDLVANDTNAYLDVFRRDLLTGTMERVSVLPNGDQLENTGNGNFDARLAISGDGRYIAFMSPFDLVGDGNGDAGCYCLYLRDMQTGVTRFVGGTPATSPIGYVAMSDNGRYLAYTTNIASPNPQSIWVYDIQNGTQGAAYSYGQDPYPIGQRQGLSISADGRFIAFTVNSPDLTGSTFDQVLVVDRNNPAVPTLVSTGANGAGTGNSAYPKISGDGRYVLFETHALNLTADALTPLRRYAIVRDLVAGTTALASHEPDGDPSGLGEFGTHAISRDGGVVAFATAQVYAEPRP